MDTIQLSQYAVCSSQSSHVAIEISSKTKFMAMHLQYNTQCCSTIREVLLGRGMLEVKQTYHEYLVLIQMLNFPQKPKDLVNFI